MVQKLFPKEMEIDSSWLSKLTSRLGSTQKKDEMLNPKSL